jgi:hypothetical protein
MGEAPPITGSLRRPSLRAKYMTLRTPLSYVSLAIAYRAQFNGSLL